MSAAPMQIVPNNRQPPHNVEAEMAFLGALFANNSILHSVNSFLRPDHFHVDAHKRIYEAAATLIDRGETANPISLKLYFDSDMLVFDRVIGGTAYLARLAGAAGVGSEAIDYARGIYDSAIRRAGIQMLEQKVAELCNPMPGDSAEQQIEQAAAELRAIPGLGMGRDRTEQAGEIAARTLDHLDAIRKGTTTPGLTTGLACLDQKLRGGMQPQELIILGGRPGMAKSGLAISIGYHNSLKDVPVEIFSLEMSKQQNIERILSMMTGIPYSDLSDGYNISDEKLDLLYKAKRKLDNLPLYVNDQGANTTAGIRSELLRRSTKVRVGLAIVDHIQLMAPPADRKGFGQRSRNDDLGAITAGLKAIAKELDIPVLALCQLSRAVEARDDKRPQLQDLRESGNIEQDADAVIMAFRPDYYVAREEPDPVEDAGKHAAWRERMHLCQGNFEAIIRKLKRGPVGTAYARVNLATNTFTDRDTSEARQTEIPAWVTE